MRKIYLLGLGALLAGGASAQSMKVDKAFEGRATINTEPGVVKDARSATATRTNTKASGDVYFSEDFAAGFAAAGWYNDTINQPDTVNDAFKWTEDTLIQRFATPAPDFASPTKANGFAAFNMRHIRIENGITPIVDPCWGGLVSPEIDLSGVPVAELPSLQISFASYLYHCCAFDLQVAVDISTDGGVTFPITNSLDAKYNVRNSLPSADNISTLAIGPKLVAAGGDLSKVRLRFRWDSAVPDGNGQTSTEYWWAIDDIKVSVALDYDFKIGDAYYGDTFYEYDYLSVPEPMIKNYPMSAQIINDGAKPGLAKIGIRMENPTLGITKTYESPEMLIGAFSDSVAVFPVFTDYEETETWTGPWNLTYYTIINPANADATTDAFDTAQARFITVTDSVWAHSAPNWNGASMITRVDRNQLIKATPTGQTFTVPASVGTIEITGMRVGLMDSTRGRAITVPNTISYELQKLAGTTSSRREGLDENFLAIYYNEGANETNGQIEITNANRAERVTASGATTPIFTDGGINDLVTGDFSVELSSGNFYFLSLSSTEPINYLSAGDPDDNSLWVYGDFGGSGEAWYTTTQDEAPMAQLFVRPLDKVGIKELATYNFSIEQNRPNPFTGSTVIDYNLNNNSEVSFNVMDITGKIVIARNAEQQVAGKHSITVNGENLNNGIYFYTISVDGKSITKKMVVNK